ncbi:MAG: DUF397 domain-containing protein [Pseudonocardiaceae bacterium]
MVEMPPPPPTAASWQQSSASGTGNCVQVARTLEHVWVRDSKNPFGPGLGLTREQWAAFLAGLKRGEFDCTGTPA